MEPLNKMSGSIKPGLFMKSPNPSAPPFPVANPAQAGRPRRKYSLYSAPSQNPLQEKGSVKGLRVS